MAAQLSATKGPLARRERRCRWRASTSLPVPDSPRISTDASAGATCSARFSTVEHGGIARDQRMRLAGRRFEDRGDQVGVGRQGQEFARALADGAHRGVGVVVDAAGDDGRGDALGRHGAHEPADIVRDFAEHHIDARIGAQSLEPGRHVVGLVELGAAGDGDAAGLAELAREGSDDQDAHGFLS